MVIGYSHYVVDLINMCAHTFFTAQSALASESKREARNLRSTSSASCVVCAGGCFFGYGLRKGYEGVAALPYVEVRRTPWGVYNRYRVLTPDPTYHSAGVVNFNNARDRGYYKGASDYVRRAQRLGSFSFHEPRTLRHTYRLRLEM